MASYTTATVATIVPTVTVSNEQQATVVAPIVTSEEMSRQVKMALQEYTQEHNHGNGSTLSLQEDHCNQHYTSGTTVAVPARRVSSPAVVMAPAASSVSRVIVSGKYKPITFDYPTQFSIRNNWYRKSNTENGDCPTTVITGGPKNSNEDMFSVTRFGEGGKLVVFKDIRELPNNGNNSTQSLLMRNQQGHMGGHKVELCYVIVDPANPTNTELWRGLPICTIERKFCNCSIRDLYDIELVGPLATKNNDSYLDCEGKLPKQMILWNEKENGNGNGGGGKKKKCKNKVAFLQKKLFRDHWKVNISKGEDVLLSIAITCTIDRIRQEFEWGCL